MGAAGEFLTFFLRDLTRWLSSSERLRASPTVPRRSGFDPAVLRPLENVDRKLVEMLAILCFVVPPMLYVIGSMASQVFGFWFRRLG